MTQQSAAAGKKVLIIGAGTAGMASRYYAVPYWRQNRPD